MSRGRPHSDICLGEERMKGSISVRELRKVQNSCRRLAGVADVVLVVIPPMRLHVAQT